MSSFHKFRTRIKFNEWSLLGERNEEIGSSSLLPRPVTEESDGTMFCKPITDADIASAQESSVPKSTEKQKEWSMKLGRSWSSNRKSLGAKYMSYLKSIKFPKKNINLCSDIARVYTIYEYLHKIFVLSTYKYVCEASFEVVKENHVLVRIF